jgi:hypothetical protein
VLTWAEDAQKLAGVTVQEEFDTTVFGLPWHEALAGRRLRHEDVVHAAGHITPDARAAKKDWYPDADRAPWPLNVVLCQRASAAWGGRAHARYANTLTKTAVVWLVALLVMGGVAHVTLAGFLIKLALPSMPAFLDAIELIRAHRATSAHKARVETMADDLWERGVTHPGSVTVADIRAVQDHSYRLRRDGPQVAEWYYRRHRDEDEAAMRLATEHKLAQL